MSIRHVGHELQCSKQLPIGRQRNRLGTWNSQWEIRRQDDETVTGAKSAGKHERGDGYGAQEMCEQPCVHVCYPVPRSASAEVKGEAANVQNDTQAVWTKEREEKADNEAAEMAENERGYRKSTSTSAEVLMREQFLRMEREIERGERECMCVSDEWENR